MEEKDYQNKNVFDTALPIESQNNPLASLTQSIGSIGNMMKTLKLDFHGIEMWQDDAGNIYPLQITKPLFIIKDKEGKPIMKIQKVPGMGEEEIYIANKEAIDTVLSLLKFTGVNRITPLSWNSEDNYQEDLLEIETKFAALLMQNRRAWGIDKKELPIIMTQFKTIIQDVRSMAVNGKTIKALQTIVSRVERHIESEVEIQKKRRKDPYGDE